MNDDLDLRDVLRAFIHEATVGEPRVVRARGEVEQAITTAVTAIQACRFCAFEKEQHGINEEMNGWSP